MYTSSVYAQVKDFETSGCMTDVGGVQVPTLKCFEVVFSNILVFSSAFVIFILFVMFVWGSFNWLTSFGNPEKIKKAQAQFRYAIVGLVVFISSYVILKTIDYLFLGGHGLIFQFHIPGPNDSL